jgi:23S rRNA pseudouridine2605 synthase
MHPSAEVKREYVCRIHGEVGDDVVQKLARGVELDDGPAKFDQIESIGGSDSHAWFRVVLHEGRNREVRRMWEAVELQVSRLKRTRYGSIELPRLLKRGQHEELGSEAVEALRASLGLSQAAAVLTLQPVIGQRRAKASEYKPGPREQRAWVNGSMADEGRELRAFDTLREDRPARPGKSRHGPKSPGRNGPRSGPGKPGGGGRRGAGRPGGGSPSNASGERLTAPGGTPGQNRNRGGNAKRGAAPGYDNPSEFRSWYVPEGVTTTSRVAPPRSQEKTDGRPSSPYGARPARPGAAKNNAPGRGQGKGPNRGPAGKKGGPRPGKPRREGD